MFGSWEPALSRGEGAFETLLRMGFNQVSEQVLLSKSIAGND